MPKKSRSKAANQARTALCYIRQSRTLDAEDTNSPRRQRNNIQRVCDQNGWIPEWYEDVGGHRSGTSEERRPEWLSLKARLGDPDIVAVVANDLSRLHRNLGGISSLIETLEKHHVLLVLAASNNDIDVTTLTGQMFAQIRGLMDAFYAKDVSAKSLDMVADRKREGKTLGMPPFGTIRNKDGYLIPTPEGAWLLPDGTFMAGEVSEPPPQTGALWRGYYECAHLILTKYVEKDIGMHRLAYEMNNEGWAFRDRYHQPRPLSEEDIRRVLANWSEYGGMVFDHPAKDRKAYEMNRFDDIPFREDRAVFPLDLLREVARNRHERSVRPNVDHGVNQETHPYALAGITYCAHCDRVAEKQHNLQRRSRLGGAGQADKRRYRHKAGVNCGSVNRSVLCDHLESDFSRLIQLLTLKEDAFHLMIELAIQSERGFVQEGIDQEKEKAEAIALCRRRIDAVTV